MREVFVSELTKEILGPRRGSTETLEADPLDEYLTGVLIPVGQYTDLIGEIEESDELSGENGASDEIEDTSDVTLSGSGSFSPSLDPKKRPSSMGMSFTVSTKKPSMKICVSWGEYKVESINKKNKVYRRNPRVRIIAFNGSDGKKFILDEARNLVFRIFVRKVNDNPISRRISLFLVNEKKTSSTGKLVVESCIFQPQIRVIFLAGTELFREEAKLSGGMEEAALSTLYKHRSVNVRGHMCSAIQKEFDPQNIPNLIREKIPGDALDGPAFTWIDGKESLEIDDAERLDFLTPDIRTEFIPMYLIPSPKYEINEKDNGLYASELAEAGDSKTLQKLLSPLMDGFELWISRNKDNAKSLPPEEQKILSLFQTDSESVLRRMRLGLQILISDERARLAYCFANKAVEIQNQWKRNNTSLKWRPFQIAYQLLTLESVTNPLSENRDMCDLLWVPTGAGKTEAYLAVLAYTLALRRLGSFGSPDITDGTAAITRYTLRLLAIQQFRRTLSVVTACEYLRVFKVEDSGKIGWRPSGCGLEQDSIWGSTPFTVGLWVGQGVSPNHLEDRYNSDGAITRLKADPNKNDTTDPAQVTQCPACNTLLAIPSDGLRRGKRELHYVFKSSAPDFVIPSLEELNNEQVFKLTHISKVRHKNKKYVTLSIMLEFQDTVSPRILSKFMDHLISKINGKNVILELASTHYSKPGYFFRSYTSSYRNKRIQKDYDFDIFCPNPDCQLSKEWTGALPAGMVHDRSIDELAIEEKRLPNGYKNIDIVNPFQIGNNYTSDRIPIPALTVDDQVYRRLPSVLVATVDKFARPAFEPKASSIFGNVDFHHPIFGYYRGFSHCSGQDKHPTPSGRNNNAYVAVNKKRSPDLILQDELHLIEGSLGGMVGIYETAVDFLCTENGNKPKYLASTATIRNSRDQVKSVFSRDIQVFPTFGLNSDDRYFLHEFEDHPLNDEIPGRLYLGVGCPGRGPLTPLYRIFSRLLKIGNDHSNSSNVDRFWTVTGYFNAIRELAGALALYRQDIPQRLDYISTPFKTRSLSEDQVIELSSRVDTTFLPFILEKLEQRHQDGKSEAVDALFTTSMFGTGIDVSRLGLMLVNGQPKTTSAYIQSTGRIGRANGGLVITFLRVSRPRDLSHYEYFTGFHRQLHRFVEPVAAFPFAPRVVDRTIGPVSVMVLRNMKNSTQTWQLDESASIMGKVLHSNAEVSLLPDIFEDRAMSQPPNRRTKNSLIHGEVIKKLEIWEQENKRSNGSNRDVKYVEYSGVSNDVVLGDAAHKHSKTHSTVYDDAPQSLRDIEETTSFEI